MSASRVASLLSCSPALLLSCSPALLLSCSPALLLSCSPALLLRLPMTYHPFLSAETGEPYGSFEVFFISAADVVADWQTPYGFCVPYDGPRDSEDGAVSDPADLAGWYWAAGFPGCLWDGDPMGPFPTEADAIADANSHA